MGGKTKAPCVRNLPRTLPRSAFESSDTLTFRPLVVITQNVRRTGVAVPTAKPIDSRLNGRFVNKWVTLLVALTVILICFILRVVRLSAELRLSRAGKLKVIERVARFRESRKRHCSPALLVELKFEHRCTS